MGRGIREVPAIPDTYGLPIYKVTKVIQQRVGDEVHMLCGTEMFSQTQWLYIVTMNAADLLVAARECAEIAQDAFNEFQFAREPMGH